MKKYFALPMILSVALLFSSCSKNDGFITEEYLALLDEVPVVSVKIDPTGNQSIDLTNVNAFSGKFTVSLYFPSKPAPAKVDIVVRKNGNNSNVKVFQANVTTFPTTFTVTAAQIVALFGAPIALGDSYDFGADVYTHSGSKYQTFPVTAIGFASGPVNMPGFSQFARYGAICAYNPAIYQGNFVVLLDEWDDYHAGDVVVLTQVSPNQFSFNYLAAGPVPIVVTVNTANNTLTVAKQVYGTLGYPPAWPYGPISAESVVNSPDNFVSPCAQEWSVRLTHTVAAGSFGSATIRMRKQ